MNRAMCFVVSAIAGGCGFVTLSAGAFPHSGVAHLYAGTDASSALLADHHLSCWGSNFVASTVAPSDVPYITTAIDASVGERFACFVGSDSGVFCWGDNSNASLGDGTFISRPVNPKPVLGRASPTAPLVPLTGVGAINSGTTHTCGILADSTAKCWGTNFAGEAGSLPSGGYASTATRRVTIHDPIRGDSFLANLVSITAGDEYSCAQLSDATVACWGWNHFGQVGNYHGGDYVSSPIPVVIADTMGDQYLQIAGGISAGEAHTCALVPESLPLNTSIACWGDNRSGQLGNNLGESSTNPAAVVFPDGSKLTNVLQVSAGGRFTCAVLADHTAACWGDNSYGQIGNNEFLSASSVSPIPVEVFGVKVTHISELATGFDQACALIDDATSLSRQEVICWGGNLSGQLGNGDHDSDTHYVPVIAAVDGPIFTDDLEGN